MTLPKPSPLNVTHVTKCGFSREPRNRRHRHNYYEICLVTSGHGHYDHGQESFALKTGDLFIADPHVVHEITSLETRDLALYFTSFSIDPESENIPADRAIRAFERGHWVHRPKRSYLAQQFDALFELQREPTAENRLYYHDHLLRLLILQMLEALTQTQHTRTAEHTLPVELLRAIDAIEAHIGSPFKISEIAALAGTSERTLRRRFREYFGHTIAQDIRRRRMRRAARLLAQPEWNTAEVGYQLGIQDPAQFTRMFKEELGVTPSQFRNDKNNARSMLSDPFMQTEFV